MQESRGKLELCPFRIKRECDLMMPDTFFESFMPCLKEKCMCYEKSISLDGKRMNECCYRDNIAYGRMSYVESED